MIWGIVAATIVVFYPLIESAEVIKNILLLRPADHSKASQRLCVPVLLLEWPSSAC